METTQAIIFLLVFSFTGGVCLIALDYILQLIWNGD